MTIVPGFVSMHAHGGGGHDYTEATEEAFRTATTAHLKHGATGIFHHYHLPRSKESTRQLMSVKT